MMPSWHLTKKLNIDKTLKVEKILHRKHFNKRYLPTCERKLRKIHDSQFALRRRHDTSLRVGIQTYRETNYSGNDFNYFGAHATNFSWFHCRIDWVLFFDNSSILGRRFGNLIFAENGIWRTNRRLGHISDGFIQITVARLLNIRVTRLATLKVFNLETYFGKN